MISKILNTIKKGEGIKVEFKERKTSLTKMFLILFVPF